MAAATTSTAAPGAGKAMRLGPEPETATAAAPASARRRHGGGAAGHVLEAQRLVQPVVHRLAEQLEVSAAQRLDDQGGARPCCRPRRPAPRTSAARRARPSWCTSSCDTASATSIGLDLDALGEQALFAVDHDDQAAVKRRRDVVGVALDLGGERQDGAVARRAAEQFVGAEQAGGRRRGARAESRGQRHGDLAVDAQAGGHGRANLVEEPAEGAHHQVAGVARQHVAALAGRRAPRRPRRPA